MPMSAFSLATSLLQVNATLSIGITVAGAVLLYALLFYGLPSLFRKFENDIALVTLNISGTPVIVIFILASLKFTFQNYAFLKPIQWLERTLEASIVVVVSYWLSQLFTEVIAYYLKDYAQQTEAMWDDVLIPLLEGVIPILIYLVGGFFLLRFFGVDLTGIWVTLGGATFVIGFAVKDILANFFSGLVLLIDTPFQFGDVVRLENGSIAVLQKIGIRVTQLYVFDNHSEIYIPNSNLQSQNIVNLSRPTTHYHYSIRTEIRLNFAPDIAQRVIREIVLAHPDTLGDIEEKLKYLDQFYLDEADSYLLSQKEAGRLRLLAENEVNSKLEEIEQALEALVVTLQFAERGGLSQEDIEIVQREYNSVLDLIGLKVVTEGVGKRSFSQIEETQDESALISLVREWYRVWLRDPNLLDEDQYILPDEWERKIGLLKRRVTKLFQKILNPKAEETRLDDYVTNLIKWLRERFKQSRNQWQQPKVWMTEIKHEEEYSFTEFTIKFYVDDIKLEHCERGSRVTSEVQREMMRQLREAYIYPGMTK